MVNHPGRNRKPVSKPNHWPAYPWPCTTNHIYLKDIVGTFARVEGVELAGHVFEQATRPAVPWREHNLDSDGVADRCSAK
jgi:hypothetical protein